VLEEFQGLPLKPEILVTEFEVGHLVDTVAFTVTALEMLPFEPRGETTTGPAMHPFGKGIRRVAILAR